VTSLKEENIRKLIIGTAQFGLSYGISNKRGQILQIEAGAILKRAKEAGISTLDTAAAYGESEESIGSACTENNLQFQIISKYPPSKPDLEIKDAFEASLLKLGTARLYGYFLHSFSSYSQKPNLLHQLQQLKESGKVEKIGISLYHPQEALELLEKEARLDIVQFPYSVFDRRFEQVLPLLRQQGIETHVRSVFLQGLYFLAPHELPGRFSSVAPKIRSLHKLAKHQNILLGAILMGFAFSNPYISNLVIGVEGLETLEENISYCGIRLNQEVLQELQNYQVDDEEVILPYKWTAI
jgi:aryl-alcohol dehydrogenase-like predicted oxidoreductase